MQDDERGVPVGEAASSLGISIPAVRKRIHRGSLRAYKVDGEWRVILSPGSEAGRDAGSPPDSPAGVDAGRVALVEELRAHIEDLRGQVASLQRTNEYQAAALAEHVWCLAELPAGPVEPQSAPDRPSPSPESTPESPPAARSPWWRRIFGGGG